MEAIIETKNGKIKGTSKISRLEQQYYAFFGVPYGKPPIGNLRFKAPRPAEPWKDILDATQEKPGPFELQPDFEGMQFSEDCLHLNVFTPNVSSLLRY